MQPFVSVVIPCLNEARFIRDCIDSVLANDYPAERFELLLVDGGSVDGTRDMIEHEEQRRGGQVRLVNNPKGVTPAALNAGIAAARGDLILRMDAHARIDPHYISRSVDALHRFNADNVGGIMHTLPQRNTVLGRAIAAALSHRFGVGNSLFRVHSSEPRWVDTVFGGCYRREVFTRIGMFNEGLSRGQDMEFNLRLKQAGGRTLLVPDIVSYYYARGDALSFWRHNWNNGVWAILPFLYSTVVPVSARHLVPLFFVLALTGSALTALSAGMWWPFAAIVFAYLAAASIAAVDSAVRNRDARLALVMPIVFMSLHCAYGLGSLWGTVRLIAYRTAGGQAAAASIQER